MVMPPQVPITQKALFFYERAQVAVLRLGAYEFRNHSGHLGLQTRVVAHTQRLNRRNQVLADKLASPGDKRRFRRTVPHPEHLQHARVRVRRGQ